MSHRDRKFFGTWAVVATGVVLLLGGLGPGTSAQVLPGLPDVVGQWTAPFEEGGATIPACSESDGRILCKPVGYASAALPDGRVFYFNGAEGTENVKMAYGNEFSVQLRNSRARIMDLRSGTPQWFVPTPEDGGGTNPDVRPGNPGFESDPLGTAGVPGRPGDGPVGSTVGQVVSHESKNDSDDRSANDSDMFCGDFSSLADGRLVIMGGTDFYNEPAGPERDDPMNPTGVDMGLLEVVGVRSTRIFDYRTNAFTQGGHMKYARWYPTSVPLADGEVLVAGGVVKLVKSTQMGNVRRTETFDPATNAWTENYTGPASENALPLLPRLHLMPNGQVFYNGTGQGWNPFGQDINAATFALQQFFDPETKQWSVAGVAPLGARGTATELLLPLAPPYDKATILSFGGTLGPTPSGVVATPLSVLTTVAKDGNIASNMTGNLNHARWFSSGVLLPDGQVLAVNGADKDELHSPGFEMPVKTPELFDPRTGQWTEMAKQSRDRTYHSSALLLPDMRVLVGGHAPAATMYGAQHDAGGPFANNDRDPSFEIWSPPYLFRGARPSISSAPAGIGYGESFPIGTPDAADVDSVRLIKLPSVEHTVDADQRTVVLDFERDGDGLQAVSPPSGAIAPPGAYYLIVNKKSDSGPIPSLSRIVFLGTVLSGEAPQPFTEGSGTTVGSANQPQDSGYFSNAPSALTDAAREASDAPAAVRADDTAIAELNSLTAGSHRRAPSPLVPLAAATLGVSAASMARRRRR